MCQVLKHCLNYVYACNTKTCKANWIEFVSTAISSSHWGNSISRGLVIPRNIISRKSLNLGPSQGGPLLDSVSGSISLQATSYPTTVSQPLTEIRLSLLQPHPLALLG